MDQRISFVTLAVADLDRTRAFYVDGLGWDSTEEVEPGEGMRIVQLTLALGSSGFESEVGPIRRGEPAPYPSRWRTTSPTDISEVGEILARTRCRGQRRAEA